MTTDYEDRILELDNLLPEEKITIPRYFRSDLKKIRPPAWLIDNYLPQGGLCVGFGPPGVGKSHLFMDWALSIAMGRPWFGKKVKQGFVAYVMAEGESGLDPRVTAWETHRRLAVTDDKIAFYTEPVQLMEARSVDAWIEEWRTLPEPPSLVVLDTLALCLTGADENSSRDIGIAVTSAKRIQREFGTAVLLVHHSTKGGTTERGSGALRGACDSMISLSAEDAVIRCEVSKMKDGTAAEPLDLCLVPVANSVVLSLPAYGGNKDKLSPDQRRALEALTLQPNGVSWREWLLMSELRGPSFRRVVHALVAKGFVALPEGKKSSYTITGEGEAALM